MSITCWGKGKQVAAHTWDILTDMWSRLNRRYQNYRNTHGEYSLIDLQEPEEGTSLLDLEEVEHPYETETRVIRHDSSQSDQDDSSLDNVTQKSRLVPAPVGDLLCDDTVGTWYTGSNEDDSDSSDHDNIVAVEESTDIDSPSNETDDTDESEIQ